MRAADFVQSYFEAWNHRDAQAVADHLACDGVYCDVPEQSRHSHRQLIAHLREFFSAARYRYRLIGEVLATGDTIAFQYEMIPHAGESNRTEQQPFRGAEFVTLYDDAAMRIVDYYEVPGRSRDPLTPSPGPDAPTKYTKSGLTDARLAEYRRRLLHLMRTHRPFLQPDLTLPGLATALGCSINHLSQVINSGLGMSFFDFVNGYRIAHARDLLASPAYRDRRILNIAFAAGFNSSSAFYTAFRKHTGRSPAEYRRWLREEYQ